MTSPGGGGPDPAGNWFAALPVTIDPAALASLFTHAPPFLRRFHHADVHLTLAFFGRLPAERVAAVAQLLATIAIPAIEAAATGLALLPSSRRPSALSLTLGRGRSAATAAIRDHRDELLRIASRPADDRPPFPHITVARPPRRAAPGDLHALREWLTTLRFHPVTLRLDPPRLYGWSRDRLTRQFAVFPWPRPGTP